MFRNAFRINRKNIKSAKRFSIVSLCLEQRGGFLQALVNRGGGFPQALVNGGYFPLLFGDSIHFPLLYFTYPYNYLKYNAILA